jgi:hypothetical protein
MYGVSVKYSGEGASPFSCGRPRGIPKPRVCARNDLAGGMRLCLKSAEILQLGLMAYFRKLSCRRLSELKRESMRTKSPYPSGFASDGTVYSRCMECL